MSLPDWLGILGMFALAGGGWGVGGYVAGYWRGRIAGQEQAIEAVNKYLAGLQVVTLSSLKEYKAATPEVRH